MCNAAKGSLPDEAFRRKEFTWNQVSLDQVIAYQLALTAQEWRSRFLDPAGPVKPANNVGNGAYYVTDASEKNLVVGARGVQEPVVGTNNRPDGADHAEQKLVTDLGTNIIPKLIASNQLQAGSILHYDLFTRFRPCENICTPKLVGWANWLRDQLPPGVSFIFKIWTTRGNADQNTLGSLDDVRLFWVYNHNGRTGRSWHRFGPGYP